MFVINIVRCEIFSNFCCAKYVSIAGKTVASKAWQIEIKTATTIFGNKWISEISLENKLYFQNVHEIIGSTITDKYAKIKVV